MHVNNHCINLKNGKVKICRYCVLQEDSDCWPFNPSIVHDKVPDDKLATKLIVKNLKFKYKKLTFDKRIRNLKGKRKRNYKCLLLKR